MDDLEALSDDVLRKMSLEKQRNGCYTRKALKAQAVLNDRHSFSPYGGRFHSIISADGVKSRSTKKYTKDEDWRGNYD